MSAGTNLLLIHIIKAAVIEMKAALRKKELNTLEM
jgi:hypothetical protein